MSAQPHGFDPAYFGPEAQAARTPRGKGIRKPVSYRRPGVDAGTFLWPLAFAAVHLVTMVIIQSGFIFVRFFLEGLEAGIRDEAFTPSMDQADLMQWLSQYFAQMAIVYSIIQIGIYVLFLRSRERIEKHYVMRQKLQPFEGISAFFMTLAALGTAVGWMLLLDFLSKHLEVAKNLLENYQELAGNFAGPNIFLNIIGICILVPAAEELLFRGIIMAELRRVVKTWPAVFISAFLFAAFHMNLVQSTYVFIAGIALGLAYLASENIALPIAMHMLYNFGGSVLPQLLSSNETAVNVMTWIYIAFIPVGIIFAVLLYKKRKQPALKPEPQGEPFGAGLRAGMAGAGTAPLYTQPGMPYQAAGRPQWQGQGQMPYQPGQPQWQGQGQMPYQPGQPQWQGQGQMPYQPGQPQWQGQGQMPYQPGQPQWQGQGPMPYQPGQPQGQGQGQMPYQPGQPAAPAAENNRPQGEAPKDQD